MKAYLVGVYRIRNLVNGNLYVGSSLHLQKRKSVHFRDLRKGTHHSQHLQRAWQKYGESNFVFEVMFHCAKETARWYEQKALDVLQPAYNVLKIAGSPYGRKHTEDAKEKMRIAKVGKVQTPEHKAAVLAAAAARRVKKGLSPEQVRDIRIRLSSGENRKDVRATYGISRHIIDGILRKKSYAYVTD